MTQMIVVTGSSGFIGSRLVGVLTGAGHEVVGIDRRLPVSRPEGFTHVAMELSAPDGRLREVLGAAQAVVHLAACPGVRDAAPDIARRRHRDNVVAAEVVAGLTPGSTPLVAASSSSVYGGTHLGRASQETDPLRPLGGYAQSKLEAEQRCAQRSLRGGHVTVVRPFTVVGPGQRPDMALARWIECARRSEPLPVFGRLDRRRDVTDVRDVARALAALIELPPTILNIGTGHARTLAELIAAVQSVHGDTGIESLDPPVPEPDETRADTARFTALLGFTPVTDLRDVVEAQSALSRPAA